MNDLKLKNLTAKIETVYEYGKRKAKLEIVKSIVKRLNGGGFKTSLTVYVLNPLFGDDDGDRRPCIEFNGKKAKYINGLILGGMDCDMPARNNELMMLVKDVQFNKFLKEVFMLLADIRLVCC